MLAVVFAVAALLLVAIIITLAARRSDTVGEVERFHRAAQMTSEWSRAYTGTPPVATDRDAARRKREQREQPADG